ncbi:MAG TPA: FliG C-terminal domain-containing protein [Isosphaeraceae bacterium]|nr:FliG C-terminal domain-containing protein [Isosphaeraceae bacterium]
MSSLLDFEDLGLLDGGDLRAVFGQVPDDQVVAALVGTPAGLRRRLLTKLPAAAAARLDARVDAHGPVTFEAARDAQLAVLDALRRLSRGGQIAFDDPEDMVA